ncbi:MAG: AAA family ATPase [Candidatus Giovannonibacteria bacterium]|nr:MAG: AAA family ATPase [Candidatus Giovannonibacteria bacterium]
MIANFRFALDKPTLILGAGIASSGKSTVFRPIAAALFDSVYVEKDLINDAFLWMPKSGERRDMSRYLVSERISNQSPIYRDHIWLQSYHCMLMLARQALELGKHPILEGNYVKEIRWGYIEKVLLPQLAGINYKLKILLAHAPADLIRERIIKRDEGRDKKVISSDEEWQRLLAEQPPIPPEIEKYPHMKIDTSEALSLQALFEIMRFLAD